MNFFVFFESLSLGFRWLSPRFLRVFGGGRKPATWGIGGEATKGFAGVPLAGSMLAYTHASYDPHTNHLTKLKGNPMRTNKSRLHQTNFIACSSLVPIFSLFIGATLLSGCASSALERERARNVLQKQDALIAALKSERSAPEVSTRVSADETLAAAEKRLNAALDAIQKSNEAMTKTLDK